MPDQLVCTKCWKWYDGRTLCPTCKVPLVSPDTGKPLPELEASPAPAPAEAPPAWPAGGEAPAPAAETFVETPLPRMSGYPTGTPLTPPTRLEIQHYLADNPGATAPRPLAARLAPSAAAAVPAAAPAPSRQPGSAVPPPPAGPPLADPAAGARPPASLFGTPFSPPDVVLPPGPGSAPPPT